MGQVRMHYAKLNKPRGERQILYGITYIWNLKKKKVISQIEELEW